MKGMEEITAKQSQPKGRTRKKKIKIIEAAAVEPPQTMQNHNIAGQKIQKTSVH
jgi:hypothetical protein